MKRIEKLMFRCVVFTALLETACVATGHVEGATISVVAMVTIMAMWAAIAADHKAYKKEKRQRRKNASAKGVRKCAR